MAIKNKRLKLFRGATYTFDVSNSSLASHPLKFSADSGSTEYTDGVTLTGTQGQAGATITFVVPADAPDNMNYYCGTHGLGMGNHILITGVVADTESDGSFFGSYRSHFNITAASGTLYTSGTGTVFYIAIDEGVPPTNESDGSFFIDSDITVTTDSDTQYGGGYGLVFNITATGGSWYGDRALIMGGKGVALTSPDIEYINITTPGNAQSFGNFHRKSDVADNSEIKNYGVAVGDAVYAVYSGGQGHNNTHTTQMDYLTIATLGNTSTFGDLPDTQFGAAGTSNGTIALLTGGKIGNAGSYQPNDHSQEVYKFTIATPGNAVDSLHELIANNGRRLHGAVGNDTISISVGGRYYDGSTAQSTNNMEYLSYNTTGSATTFGTMNHNPMWVQASGNKTRGIINGGIAQHTSVRGEYEYITMATPGNSVDFGDMDLSVNKHSSTSNETRVVSTGGSHSSSYLNNIQYVTIDTPGNGTDFGDLIDGRMYTSNTSGAAA
jgi:hypothetical protein